MLHKWENGMGPVIFAASERLGVEHADPLFEQIGTLQKFFQRVDVGDASPIEGTPFGLSDIGKDELRSLLRSGYLWWDWVRFLSSCGHRTLYSQIIAVFARIFELTMPLAS